MFERMINNEFLREGMPLPNPKPIHKITFLSDPKLYPDMYKEKFKNVDLLETNEIYKILEASLGKILEKATENSLFEQQLLMNDKILNVLLRVFIDKSNKGEYMSYQDTFRFNSIALSCLESNSEYNDIYTELAYQANKYIIDSILPLGEVERIDVIKMVLYFFRSNDPLCNVIRMNNFILKLPNKLITDYYMMRLYEVLCSDLDLIGLTNIAISVLFDYNIITNDNENKNMSSMINAVLILIDQNPSLTRIVLIDLYNHAHASIDGKVKGMRISLSKGLCPTEFRMLCETLNRLALQENIYLP